VCWGGAWALDSRKPSALNGAEGLGTTGGWGTNDVGTARRAPTVTGVSGTLGRWRGGSGEGISPHSSSLPQVERGLKNWASSLPQGAREMEGREGRVKDRGGGLQVGRGSAHPTFLGTSGDAYPTRSTANR
jgi:hypothetical protein